MLSGMEESSYCILFGSDNKYRFHVNEHGTKISLPRPGDVPWICTDDNRLRIEVLDSKVGTIKYFKIIANARNVEVYESGKYLQLVRGVAVPEPTLIQPFSCEQHENVVDKSNELNALGLEIKQFVFELKYQDPKEFGELTFKFLGFTRGIEGVKIEDLTLHLDSPKKAPPKPEASSGGGQGGLDMAMMMMMALGGAGAKGSAQAPPRAGEVVVGVDGKTMGKKTEDTENGVKSSSKPLPQSSEQGTVDITSGGLPIGSNMVALLMSEVSTLLDSKVQPIISKLDRLEAQVSKIEGALVKKEVNGSKDGPEEGNDPQPAINPALAADMRSLLAALQVEGGGD